jgi:hypothetical protein
MAEAQQYPKKNRESPLGDSATGRPFSFIMTIRISLSRMLFNVVLILSPLSACSPASTPTPFRPPTAQPPLIEPTLIIQPTKQVVVVQPSPLPTTAALTPTVNPQDCTNNLHFISDATIPDNSVVPVGSSVDKQWLVENSGTCNWDSSYRLKHLGGAVLGAQEELMLYPARAGTQATIEIVFTAPFTEGAYESAWQAVDPDGNPFGDPIYMRITVQ